MLDTESMIELRCETACETGEETPFECSDAIFALATVPGKSAVAVFRCSGERVWQYFERSFSRYDALETARGHSAVYGFLRRPAAAPSTASPPVSPEPIDEVLLLKFCAPRSYSGQDMLEIHCHGSLAVLEAVRRLLRELGLRPAQRGEFSYRSIKYGKRSLHQAEAIALLSETQSQNQRRSALWHLQRLDNSLLRKLSELRSELLQLLARTELQLDYDETELEFEYPLPDSLPLAESCLGYLRSSLASFRLQQSCWQTRNIVLVGAANSGKSLLFNRLLRRERSIVSAQAGTTRDYLEALLELAGQSIRLYDTAGLRHDSVDSIEEQGIRRSWELLEQADFLLLLSDVRVVLPELLLSEDKEQGSRALAELCQLRSRLLELAQQRGSRLLEVWNKIDLLDAEGRSALVARRQDLLARSGEQGASHHLFFCSAKSGQGLGELLEFLEQSLPAQLALPDADAPVSERQARLLEQAAVLLQEYCNGLRGRGEQIFDLDWGSELLRQICGRLGEVSGEACNAAMLREIFQEFCVGK